MSYFQRKGTTEGSALFAWWKSCFPLAFHPGETWHYSVGIDVAGRLIEVLSGQSLGESYQLAIGGLLKRRHIFNQRFQFDVDGTLLRNALQVLL